MVSEKQLAANQRNARKSTGPRTTKGKAVASKNAIKHGLLSSEPVMDDESEQEFGQFRDAMFTDLAPLGQLECFLVDRIAASAWRLRRAVRVEGKMLQGDFERRDGQPRTKDDATLEISVINQVIYQFTYGKFTRYEAHIERGLYKALHELQRLQAARSGEAVPAPVAVDVEVTGVPPQDN